MRRALILGGTGCIGLATAKLLLASGWKVELTGRDPTHLAEDVAAAGGKFVAVDRNDGAAMRAALGDGADLLVDCICYTAKDATGLLPMARACSSTVMISSKAVYVDSAGNHSNSTDSPDFDGPIREEHPTVAPDDCDYDSREGYGANKVAAELVLLGSGVPVTVLRPSKVHGAWARRPREWVFVKRALDRRPAVFLAHRGAGIDHPTAAANVAALIQLAARVPGRRILNSADPDSPSALEISRIIARQLGHVWEEVLLDPGADPDLGRHPWDCPNPIVLDMSAATELGYLPVGDYADTVVDEVQWLVRAARGSTGFPVALDESYFSPMLDYTGEDRWLANAQIAAGRHSGAPG